MRGRVKGEARPRGGRGGRGRAGDLTSHSSAGS